MAYLRSQTEELTGLQTDRFPVPETDLGCDFIMVYGIDSTMPERIRAWKSRGYIVHLMTGIAWGTYEDYLDGKWDGRSHWDEAQTDRSQQMILHNPRVPYMVPTVAFSDFLSERMRAAVDAGAVAIHVEEPEFWDYGGYSKAFEREYELAYHEPFVPQHQSTDSHVKAARLKAALYSRTIRRISASLKEYAKVTKNLDLRFYVPTHSLVNYSQWKIMSPEADLINIPTVDGCIAQVWTGTSRVGNIYEGRYRERTFETAFLEYGVMQELVRGTGRRMWFLNDPIEDQPTYTWDDYEKNYRKTAAASLLQPAVHHFEICPWPNRIFLESYPRIQPEIVKKDETSFAAREARPIPDSYRTYLSSMFQLFGDMDQEDWQSENCAANVGVFMSDSGLFERTFPEEVLRNPTIANRLLAFLEKTEGNTVNEKEREKLMEAIDLDPQMLLGVIEGPAFPQFFGLTMPLIKYGLPVRPVQLDNICRFPGYLDSFSLLILSYEFLKPNGPEFNMAILSWVQQGGSLLYIGDGSDPFHHIDAWWTKAGFHDPAEHLFFLSGLTKHPQSGSYTVGQGQMTIMRMVPARICLKKSYADQYRDQVKNMLSALGFSWLYRNDLTLRRGPYVISSVMEESVNAESRCFDGLFADLQDNAYTIREHVETAPGDTALLFNFDRIKDVSFRVIGTSARLLDMACNNDGFTIQARAANQIRVFIRLRIPGVPHAVSLLSQTGPADESLWSYDPNTRTVLLSWRSHNDTITIHGSFE